ncbi:MAG: BrnT family toxin [Alphaproteobacteria bacterium HGW-Alphaproteobacteria-5]|nr:MAG: BrnT family toxin [Alphaproteobacteria bacterium HGW-Alphaproteobacteria-5]
MEEKPAYEAFDPPFVSFAWDENKRRINIERHGIDFVDILPAFGKPMARKRSDRKGELRYLVIGDLDGREIAAAYREEEGDICRIISARQASRNERAAYRALLLRGGDEARRR